VTKCRFLEYSFLLEENGSIKFEELDASKLDIKPGDGFMSFVDPSTNEVTLRKIDLTKVEHIEI
jgi:hypothetical protein